VGAAYWLDSGAAGASFSVFYSAGSLIIGMVFSATHGADICSASKTVIAIRLNQSINFMINPCLMYERVPLERELL
jgi:hypothetical protein